MIDPQLPHDSSALYSQRTLRQFAGLWIVVFLGLASWQGFRHERWLLASILMGLGIAIGVLGLARPRMIKPIFAVGMKLAYPIHWFMSNLLLSLFFYLVFWPIGMLFKLTGRDVLQLRPAVNRATYLVPKPPAAGVQSYFRQS